MNIMLFGMSNVGKTTIGKILANKLGYDFYDLDLEIKKKFNMTMEEFVNRYRVLSKRDMIRGQLIGEILQRDSDKVIAITQMYYSRYFMPYIEQDGNLAVELQDTVENIFNRLVFSDSNDQICDDSVEYRNAHKDYYMQEIEQDYEFYKKSFSKIENKFFINNDSPERATDRLIEQYQLK